MYVPQVTPVFGEKTSIAEGISILYGIIEGAVCWYKISTSVARMVIEEAKRSCNTPQGRSDLKISINHYTRYT